MGGAPSHDSNSTFADKKICLLYDAVNKLISARLPGVTHSLPIPNYRLAAGSATRNAVGAGSATFRIYGRREHHFPFLSPFILEHFLPFVLDKHLPRILEVCCHWFVTIHRFILHQWTRKITQDFKSIYSSILLFEKMDFSVQPLYTEDFAIRIDHLIFAKVLPAAKNKCLEIANTWAFMQPTPQPSFEAPQPPKSHRNSLTQRAVFRIQVKPKGAVRDLWYRKDSTRFHGDEILVVGQANVPQVCVDDRIEIPINLSNGLGIMDPTTFRWAPPKFLTSKDHPPIEYGQKCTLETEPAIWYEFDKFVGQTPDPIVTFDLFRPQWCMKSAEYLGTSIVISRTKYVADCTGIVEKCTAVLGLCIRVLERGSPVVVSVKRLGMEHDRFANQQIRVGDRITLFVVQGGPEPP